MEFPPATGPVKLVLNKPLVLVTEFVICPAWFDKTCGAVMSRMEPVLVLDKVKGALKLR